MRTTIEARPTCNECGQWVPENERSMDEFRNGNRYILCATCDTDPGRRESGPYPTNVRR